MKIYGASYIVFCPDGKLEAGTTFVFAESRDEAIGKTYKNIVEEFPSILGYKEHVVSVTRGYVEGTVFEE